MSHPGPTWGPRGPGLPTALTLEEEARVVFGATAVHRADPPFSSWA